MRGTLAIRAIHGIRVLRRTVVCKMITRGITIREVVIRKVVIRETAIRGIIRGIPRHKARDRVLLQQSIA